MKDKTVIVEFNGLPGLGKTTVANVLRDELNRDGYKAIGWYRHSIWESLRPMFAIPYSFSLYRVVRQYANTIEPYRKDRTHVHWTNHFVRMYNSIEKYSDADYAVSDEGIIQFLVAMGYKDHFPQTEEMVKIVEKIKEMGISFVRVDCENHVEEAAERIRKRPQKKMVLEDMGDEELLSTLKVESDNFDYLRQVFTRVDSEQTVINIDTVQNSPQYNSDLIMSIIKR